MCYRHILLQDYDSLSTKLNRGFTIIELTVVIVVIGILAAIVSISYGDYLKATAQTSVKSDLKMAVSSLTDHQNYNNAFPPEVDDLPNLTTSDGVVLSGGSVDGGLTFCVDGQTTKFSDVKYHVDSESRQVKLGECPKTKTVHLRLLLRGPNTGKVVVKDGLLNHECVKSDTEDPLRCDFNYKTLDPGPGKTLTSVTAYPDNPADSVGMQWRDCWQDLITSQPLLGAGSYTGIGGAAYYDLTYQVNFGSRTWDSGKNCWEEGY